MNTIRRVVKRAGFVCLVFLCLTPILLNAQAREEIRIILLDRGIKLENQNHYFTAPYLIQAGDTVRSVANSYYGSEKAVATLSQVNNVDADEPLQAGTNLLLIATRFKLRFHPARAAEQSRQIRNFLQTAGQDTTFHYREKVKLSMRASSGGETIYEKYDVYQCKLTSNRDPNLALQLVFSPTPAVDLLIGNTEIDTISVVRGVE